jgi:hypothetical protein
MLSIAKGGAQRQQPVFTGIVVNNFNFKYVHDFAAKTNGDIYHVFMSRPAWDANVALHITLTALSL